LYAPGLAPNSECPLINQFIPRCEGTFVSAGQITGLVAYFLSLTGIDDKTGVNNAMDVPANQKRWIKMKNLLRSLSYQRPPGEGGFEPVAEIWNGFIKPACSSGSGSAMKARDDSPRPSSSTSTTIPTHTMPTPSLDCQQNIPSDGPTATDIANALQKNNQLATVCATKLNGSGDSTRITFNHGYIDLTLERSSPDSPLAFCNAALNSIINTCILGSKDYGGVIYQGGETYNISNSIYPNNPLIPNSDQGAPDSSQPTTPPTSAVVSVYFLMNAYIGFGGFDSSWVVFQPSSSSYDFDVCTAKQLDQATPPGSMPLQNPWYPSYLKFSSHGLGDCVYTGTSSTIGSFKCLRFGSSSCSQMNKTSQICDGSTNYTPLLQCSW
jgi:hypothetical protein